MRRSRRVTIRWISRRYNVSDKTIRREMQKPNFPRHFLIPKKPITFNYQEVQEYFKDRFPEK